MAPRKSLIKQIIPLALLFGVFVALGYISQIPALPATARYLLAAVQFFMLVGAFVALVVYAAWSTWKHRRLEAFLLLVISTLNSALIVPAYLRVAQHYVREAFSKQPEPLHDEPRAPEQYEQEYKAPVMPTQDVPAAMHEEEPAPAPEAPARAAGITELHNKEEFEAFIAQESALPLVIKVSASWCPPCQKLKPIYHDVAHTLNDKAVFAEVDIDQFTGTEALKVMSLPTILYFKNGKEVTRTVGFRTAEQLQEDIAQSNV